ncbi:unannotated protein [freshwater metagenome]|uniref:Unannotated protein n=1 Tax=freshwater metagenome TaxID=449393 RepID=A0A6J7JAC1_9ZZZZ|nr:alpha/beta fold hydrolase [Actinomycetota bacterium]
MLETAVLLHGFGGTGRGWDPVADAIAERYRSLALDLRGHGGAAAARPVSIEHVVADILAAVPERFALAGYSMGGRVALHVALAAPQRVTRLILLSTSAGIEDDAARRARRAADEALAGQIEEEDDLDVFAARWLAQPLFADDSADAQARARADIARSTPAGLAAALRGLGPGAVGAVWDELPCLDVPTLLLSGERDPRYVALAERMATSLPHARAEVVAGVGHALVRVAPVAVARAIAAF